MSPGQLYTLDNTGPVVTGAISPAPNAAGWNTSDVTVTWTATDDRGSGVASQPGKGVILGEGRGLTTSATVRDNVGNETTAQSPPVNIDRTAPTTHVTAPPAWNKNDVTLTLGASDGLSGVDQTFYRLDDGVTESGTNISVKDEGSHTLEYWSTDTAGNTEQHHTVSFGIDKTSPTIGHTLNPAPNADFWNNSPVTVTFDCQDSVSGIASCTGPQTVDKEGAGLTVLGSATDRAGNTADDPATVNLDLTGPVLSLSDLPAANANGWYNHPVTVTPSATDALSGIKSVDGAHTFGEGEGQTATFHATDTADNTSSLTTGKVNVDTTAPTITGTVVTKPNANGWFDGDVTVHWACDDTLSEVATCPDGSVVTGEGGNLAVSAEARDRAGNVSTATVTGIKIDRSAPTTTADGVPQGWVNKPVTVALNGSDNLSPEVTTYYTVDDADPVQGSSVTVGAEGHHTVSYWSVDQAGNTEKRQSFDVDVDLSAPTVTTHQSPDANGKGWNNSDVEVGFSCTDQAGLSGIAHCPSGQTVTEEGTHTVTGTATDHAGNSTTASRTVSLDKTAPTITGAADREPNGNGWYKDDVTVTFTGTDKLSGIQDVTAPQTLGQGEGQSVEGTATDVAGNTATTTVDGINVDKTKPSLSAAPTEAPNDRGWYNRDVTLVWSAADDLSGLDGATPANSVLDTQGEAVTATATARDKAGNETTVTSEPVRIDTTAPTTSVSAPDGWQNGDVKLALHAADNLSSVESTHYTVDGGDEQTGTSLTLADEGTHHVSYWSVDNAGNVEDAKAVTIQIDKTAPTISHELDPRANDAGWNNSEVTVTFTCEDQADLSGVASCTAPVKVTDEGRNQSVHAEATDNAGNSSTYEAIVNIDKTPPTIEATRSPEANAYGWNNQDVTVSFACADKLSGLEYCTAPETLSRDGKGQSVAGTAYDVAGNISSAQVDGINIDKTAPTLSGAPTTAPNSNGWYRDDVTIHWTAGDNLSGIPEAPKDSVITGEGDTLTATTSVSDRAGNSRQATTTVVKIDRHAPVTTADAPKGWTNGPTTLTLGATDNLSGVAATFYSVDGGDVVEGTELTLGTEGAHTVTFHSVDAAGNVEEDRTATVKIDLTAPTIGHTLTPAANAVGWNNSPVTVDFQCADQDLLSGLESCTDPVTLTDDGTGQQVLGTAVDKAGNVGTDTATVSIDTVKPEITGTPDRAANDNGWYAGDVTVSFDCHDGLSGMAGCTGPQKLGEGGNQTVTGTATDVADNAATTTVGPINVDKTAPTLEGAPTTKPNGNGWYNGDVAIHWTPGDELSGVDRSTVPGDGTITGEGANLTTSASVRDLAGNETTATSPAVNIDRTAPTTKVSGISDWSKDDVTVTLTATDNLSGVASTRYQLDEQDATTGEQVTISTEGVHTLKVWSVDRAGNTEAVQNLTVRIDKTAPGISHTQDPEANKHGWNNSDVTVTFICTDGGSGVDTCTKAQTVTTEGGNQPVPGTAVDKAGNTNTDVASVSIDKTAPTLTGQLSAMPNGNGWFKDDVTVSFTCADQAGLSGVLSCPDKRTLGEGTDQSVSGTATDAADNTSAPVTVKGINVDKTAPVLSGAATTAPNDAGWYHQDVVVHWTASDPLSGLDGAAPADVTLTGEGAQNSATATVTDKAGNSTTVTVGGIPIDRTAPSTTATAPDGWQNHDVTVKLSASDALSGVATTYYSLDGAPRQAGTSVTVTDEGTHQLTYWSVDTAGNSEAHHTATVLVDKTVPVITGAATTKPNSEGWFNGPVTVHFDCTDQPGLSGIASCQQDTQVASDGDSNVVNGSAVDNAGNVATTTVGPLKIDTTAPAVTIGGVANGGSYVLGAAPKPTCSATDATSGLAGPCTGAVSGGTSNGVGEFTYTATATDKAGNTGTASVTYTVKYAVADGIFLDPVIAPGHAGTATTSIFKAGQTIPMKFQLRDATGKLVQAGSAPRWLTPQRVADTAAAVNTDGVTDAGSSTESYSWNGSQYQYNWKTDKAQAGATWRVGVALDDGQTYYVTIGLR
ncbi:MAG TPA: PxKF domain-containing protein [Segeticoccus sp.]|uniref:OmpL47-type beta-barrel domain-containing protein n=1 Tax=Segeticoccus sp. TaxID=2706531 RepID=UPI002D803755|nr:PxKF domain-containing protein [Segeticoccus sp.]HET8601893.1 PxKF domain-containing protein [Segeticoccus sp.]